MKVNLFRNFFMTAFAVAALVLAGCSEDNPIDPDPTLDLKAPKNLMATSIDENTIRIKWTASDDETSADFKEYIVSYKPETSSDFVMLTTAAAITNSTGTVDITDLDEGVVYDIRVVTKASDNTLGTVSANVKWSPSRRFVETEGLDPIRIYESATATLGSGLDVFPDAGEPYSVTLGSAAKWNLGLYTTGGVIKFGSAKAVGYNAITVNPDVVDGLMYSNPKNAADLDDVFDSGAMNAAPYNYSSTAVDLSSSAYDTYAGAVFYVKVGNNYAKVLVKKGASGWLQGDSPNRYLELEIAYQATENVPYAKTSN